MYSVFRRPTDEENDKMAIHNDHLTWCKQRALEILDAGNIHGAYTSMISDMGNHPDTKDHDALMLGMQLMVNGHLNTDPKMRKFIEDFN